MSDTPATAARVVIEELQDTLATAARDVIAGLQDALDAAERLATLLPEPEPAAPAPADNPKRKFDDGKITTSLRIEPEKLGALKMIALRKRVRVNDLVVQGIDHVIALHKQEAA